MQRNFVPSFRENNGVRFDKFVPRERCSGPLVHGRAWFVDGAELEADDIYVSELPKGANTDPLWRESNLSKAQVNLDPSDILIAGLLYNNFHSPFDGLSALVPQSSTTKRTTIAWLPYLREQHSFSGGTLLELGVADQRIRDGYVPRGDSPFEITPETSMGSYFENLTSRSRRFQETGVLLLPPRHWHGVHDWKAGLDLDETALGGKLIPRSDFYITRGWNVLRMRLPSQPSFGHNNFKLAPMSRPLVAAQRAVDRARFAL